MARLKNRTYGLPFRGTAVRETFQFILSVWSPKRKRVCLSPIQEKLGNSTVSGALWRLKHHYGFITWRRPSDPTNYVRVRFLPGTVWLRSTGEQRTPPTLLS